MICLFTVLWKYSKLAGCPVENFINDDLEVTFINPQTV